MIPWSIIALVLVMALATQITRFLPFFLPRAWLESSVVTILKEGLPAIILFLLVVYCLKDTAWTSIPWGTPELLSLAVVIALHLWKRQALLSIGVGTALYMVLIQTGVAQSIFMAMASR